MPGGLSFCIFPKKGDPELFHKKGGVDNLKMEGVSLANMN